MRTRLLHADHRRRAACQLRLAAGGRHGADPIGCGAVARRATWWMETGCVPCASSGSRLCLVRPTFHSPRSPAGCRHPSLHLCSGGEPPPCTRVVTSVGAGGLMSKVFPSVIARRRRWSACTEHVSAVLFYHLFPSLHHTPCTAGGGGLVSHLSFSGYTPCRAGGSYLLVGVVCVWFVLVSLSAPSVWPPSGGLPWCALVVFSGCLEHSSQRL